MKIYILFLLGLICPNLYISANIADIDKSLKGSDANIIGHVVDKKTKEHLLYIPLSLKGTTYGTTTDNTGHYFLKNLPQGEFELEAAFLGYKTQTIKVKLISGKTIEVNFELDEDNISLDEVVISTNRSTNIRRQAPNLMSVLDMKMLQQTSSITLSQGLNFQPGLRVENNCQNCGFSQVRMNGLEGTYSQILIDSRAVFSSLSGVYGLEQIPSSMIERVEISRGAGSALSGASAIGGTINIITKEPTRNSAELSHNITMIGGKDSFDNATNLNASLVSDNHRMGVMIFGQRRYRSAYDDDGDGFSEIPVLNSKSLGFRSFINTGSFSKLTFEYHNIQEYRRGGDQLSKPPHEVYIAEEIDSSIDVGGATFNISSRDNKHKTSVYASAQLNNRKSYYGGGEPAGQLTGNETADDIENYNNRMGAYGRTKGTTYVVGTQYSYDFDKLLFMPSKLSAGIEYNRDKLNDRVGYRKDSIVDQSVNTKILYAQNEWKTGKWGFLIGGRLEKHSMLDKAVINPRANIRYNPTADINIRLNYGQGYRAPQLYDEDLHVDMAGGTHIISQRDPNLRKETSHSFSASVDWYIPLDKINLNFLAEGFYTILKDPFTYISDDLDEATIVKTITNGPNTKVYGTTLEARLSYSKLLQFQVGLTLQQSKRAKAIVWSEEEGSDLKPEKKLLRTPDVYGFFIATATPYRSLNLSLSGNYTGRMLVPYEGGGENNRTVKTQDFFELHWQASYSIPLYNGSDIDFTLGIKNIFNAYQNDFDKGKDRVSSYVYGPSLPRSFYAAVKLCF